MEYKSIGYKKLVIICLVISIVSGIVSNFVFGAEETFTNDQIMDGTMKALIFVQKYSWPVVTLVFIYALYQFYVVGSEVLEHKILGRRLLIGIAIFMVMFWLFRAIVALCTQYSVDMLGLEAYNFTYEVIIAFATIPCIVLVIKRVMIGSLLYLVMYGAYFGEHLVANIIPMLQGQATLTSDLSLNLISDAIALILALIF